MITAVSIPGAWKEDLFLSEMVKHPLDVHQATDAILVEHLSRRGRAFAGVGEPAAIAELLTEVSARGFVHGSMMRGTWDYLPETARTALELPVHEDWDWMDARSVAEVAGMEQVREVDRVAERSLIDHIRNRAIPDSYLSADTPDSRWFGWFDRTGAIRAVGGATGWSAGTWIRSAHLGSIGTEPGWQGRGIGSALTAGIAHIAVAEGASRVSLGVWAENRRAIALYQRLGFTTTHRIHSRRRAR